MLWRLVRWAGRPGGNHAESTKAWQRAEVQDRNAAAHLRNCSRHAYAEKEQPRGPVDGAEDHSGRTGGGPIQARNRNGRSKPMPRVKHRGRVKRDPEIPISEWSLGELKAERKRLEANAVDVGIGGP